MSANLPPLPPDWSEHYSTSHPGHVYYYNSKTGAKTWDRDAILKTISMNSDSKQMKKKETDINSLDIEELERLLASKKNEKQELEKKSKGVKKDNLAVIESDVKAEKRKNNSLEEPSLKKRPKIVFDMKKADGSPIGREGRRKEPKAGLENNNNIDKELAVNKSKDDLPDKKKSKADRSADRVDTSTDSSLYGMDDDEIQQLKVIKSKYASPPKSKEKKDNTLNKSNSSLKDNLNISIPSPSSKVSKKPRYLPENYGFKYVNYEKDTKQTYQRVYKPRDRPVLAKFKGDFTDKPLASSMVKDPSSVVGQVDLNRTPDQFLDITPVYGSLEDSLEWGTDTGDVGHVTSKKNVKTEAPPVTNVVSASEDENRVNVTEATAFPGKEDSWGERSFEGDRPPTPPLVQEMQEEESMEWESVDREEILKETQRVRVLLHEAMEVEDTVEEKGDTNVKGVVLTEKKGLVVVDTNIFITSLGTLNNLLDDKDVKVVIPWMVVQELDGLKSSTSRDTAVRARAAVRWLHNCLQGHHPSVLTQTADQNKRASARFESRSADDRILACCLMLKEDGNKVTLLTNDMNLSNKGMINQVQCGDAENITSVLNGEEKIIELQETGEGPDEKKVCKELIMQGENTTRELLEVVLKKEFQLAFGEKLWEKMVSIKPKPTRPHWTLSNLFTLFSKHHIAVFGLAFPRNGNGLKQRLASLQEKLKSRIWRVNQVKIVLAEMSELFDSIKERDGYEGVVDICADKLSDISSQLENFETVAAGHNSKKILGDVDDGQEDVQQLFQNVWEIIACFTRGFATCMSVPNSLPKFDPDIQFQSVADATRNLPSFFSTVSALQESMVGVVSNPGKDPELVTFHGLLTQFRANLELDQSYWPTLDRLVTLSHLKLFMTAEQNQAVVKGGLDQISDFRQILIKCISGGESMSM